MAALNSEVEVGKKKKKNCQLSTATLSAVNGAGSFCRPPPLLRSCSRPLEWHPVKFHVNAALSTEHISFISMCLYGGEGNKWSRKHPPGTEQRRYRYSNKKEELGCKAVLEEAGRGRSKQFKQRSLFGISQSNVLEENQLTAGWHGLSLGSADFAVDLRRYMTYHACLSRRFGRLISNSKRPNFTFLQKCL